MKRNIISLALICCAVSSATSQVSFKTDRLTGAVNLIVLKDDTDDVNWMLDTDGSQYEWIDGQYGWGLGYLSVDGVRQSWREPVEASADRTKVTYRVGDIEIAVKRQITAEGFQESYTFTNMVEGERHLTDIGIYTPWNDNYPSAQECMSSRCNAHIWPGGEASWVMAQRMDGKGQGVALLLTQGDIADYDIWERGMEKRHSNFRGVIALCPRDTTLRRGESVTIEWQIFPHDGWDDFERKALELGSVIVSTDKYVYERGETGHINVRTAKGIETLAVSDFDTYGDRHIGIEAAGRKTYIQLLAIPSIDELLQRRADFIMTHQQMLDTASVSCGAYMVYDNELDRIYENNDERMSSDTNDGRERIGMGIFLATWYKQHPSVELLQSLIRYADFVRNKLQDDEGNTWNSSTDHKKQRGYNYPWVADFYLRMYEVTGDRRFAADAYRTMRRYFQRFGHSFYAINIPVLRSKEVLTAAGMKAESDTLMSLYTETAHTFCDRGLNFPKSEVNYEQSIIAPALDLLCQVWLATGDGRCLDGIETLLPAMLCFNGRQPSYHLNDIAIRHWDGYWFGKRKTFGDTFPQYWSTITANVLHRLAQIRNMQGRTAEAEEYQRRAENITLQNLCLFFDDGRASCAYVYPRRVNGISAAFYDPFANDQDWAAAYYLDINKQ